VLSGVTRSIVFSITLPVTLTPVLITAAPTDMAAPALQLHLAPQGFGNDLLLYKGLEIDKAFARPAGAVDLAIGDGESGKQMADPTTMIASFVQHRLAWACWARRLFPFSCLDGGFLKLIVILGLKSQECVEKSSLKPAAGLNKRKTFYGWIALSGAVLAPAVSPRRAPAQRRP